MSRRQRPGTVRYCVNLDETVAAEAELRILKSGKTKRKWMTEAIRAKVEIEAVDALEATL